jgi:uncharacterized membrane protein YhaH (DUF805 family)
MESLDHNFQQHSSDASGTTWQMRQDWHITARWARFLSIVSFVLSGIGVLGTLSISSALEQMMQFGGDMGNPMVEAMLSQKGVLTVFLLLLIGAQIAVNLFQFRFAGRLKDALQFTDQQALEEAWFQFSNFFKWSGIMVIVFIVLYFAFIIFIVASLATLGG